MMDITRQLIDKIFNGCSNRKIQKTAINEWKGLPQDMRLINSCAIMGANIAALLQITGGGPFC
ncbi:hypothetical protein ACJCHP_004710 [Enterobacter asburiae]